MAGDRLPGHDDRLRLRLAGDERGRLPTADPARPDDGAGAGGHVGLRAPCRSLPRDAGLDRAGRPRGARQARRSRARTVLRERSVEGSRRSCRSGASARCSISCPACRWGRGSSSRAPMATSRSATTRRSGLARGRARSTATRGSRHWRSEGNRRRESPAAVTSGSGQRDPLPGEAASLDRRRAASARQLSMSTSRPSARRFERPGPWCRRARTPRARQPSRSRARTSAMTSSRRRTRTPADCRRPPRIARLGVIGLAEPPHALAMRSFPVSRSSTRPQPLTSPASFGPQVQKVAGRPSGDSVGLPDRRGVDRSGVAGSMSGLTYRLRGRPHTGRRPDLDGGMRPEHDLVACRGTPGGPPWGEMSPSSIGSGIRCRRRRARGWTLFDEDRGGGRRGRRGAYRPGTSRLRGRRRYSAGETA